MSEFRRLLVNLTEDEHRGELLQKMRRLLTPQSQVELFSSVYSAALESSHLFDADGRQHAIQSVLRRVEKGLQSQMDKLVQQGIEAGADVYWDRDRAEGVVRKALRYQPDLVMHALEPHPKLLGQLLAAADWRLLRQCPAPLLLSKTHHWPDRPRIAAAIDPFHMEDAAAELDQKLLQHAAGLAEQLEGELHVIHVFNTLPHSAIFDEHLVVDYEQLQKRVARDHRQRIGEIIAPLQLEVGDPCVHLREGEFHRVLPGLLEDESIDVLVMGSLARGFIDRLLLGSSAERLMDQISSDLLIIKPDSFRCPVTEF